MKTDFKSLFCRFCCHSGFLFSVAPINVSDENIMYNENNNIKLSVTDNRNLNILSVSAQSEESAYYLALQHFMPGKSAEEIELILAASGF